MANELIRIFSDIHYGDRSSQVRSLAQLTPLLDGADQVVLNGDSLDTRIGPYPARTAEIRAEATDFLARAPTRIVPMTGNHDPDFSALHAQTLAGEQVLVTHGDVLFENIVPWGRDVPLIRRLVSEEQARHARLDDGSLEAKLTIFRRACARIPQRHQVEQNRWKHLLSFFLDTFWPPQSTGRVLWAWRVTPERAALLAETHRPKARFVIIGHTHRPGVWRTRSGRVVINTGSFTRPLGPCLVELTPGRLCVRRIVARRGAFFPDRTMAEFALAETGA